MLSREVHAGALAVPSLKCSIRTLVSECSYPEGPLRHGGEVLFVEYARSRIAAWNGVELRTVWAQPGIGPASVVASAGGDLWVTAYDDNSVIRIEDGAPVETIRRSDDGIEIIGPNDITPARNGALYFTASGVFDPSAKATGRVFYRDPEGRVRAVANGIHYSNGLALSKDERTLFVAAHFENRILRYDVKPDGSLSDGAHFATLPQGADAKTDPFLGPDGIEVDESGTLWAAHYAGGQVVKISPDGAVLAVIPMPMRYVTNVALAEGDKSLIVTAFSESIAPFSGSLFLVDLA